MYVIDASVYVGRLHQNEPHHAACKGLLGAIQTRRIAVACPNLVWIEVAAAVRRGTGDPELARSAAELAGERGLRGADAVYVALARRGERHRSPSRRVLAWPSVTSAFAAVSAARPVAGQE